MKSFPSRWLQGIYFHPPKVSFHHLPSSLDRTPSLLDIFSNTLRRIDTLYVYPYPTLSKLSLTTPLAEWNFHLTQDSEIRDVHKNADLSSRFLSVSISFSFCERISTINQYFVFSLPHIPCNMLFLLLLSCRCSDTVVFCRFGEREERLTNSRAKTCLHLFLVYSQVRLLLVRWWVGETCVPVHHPHVRIFTEIVFFCSVSRPVFVVVEQRCLFFHFPYSQLDDFLHLSYRLSSIDFVHSHFSILRRFSSFLFLFEKIRMYNVHHSVFCVTDSVSSLKCFFSAQLFFLELFWESGAKKYG